MADSITREIFEATAHIRQACGRNPILLAMAALFLSSLALVDFFISAAGLTLLAILPVTGTGDYLALLSFYIPVFLNLVVSLLSVFLMYFSMTVSAGLPWSSSPPVTAAKLLTSNASIVSMFSLCLSIILLNLLLLK